MNFFFTFLFLGCYTASFCQTEVSVQSSGVTLYGTLLEPEQSNTVVLIISGSGKTDRNGNTNSMGYENNSLKFLADSLDKRNIASLRYDKRGVGKSVGASISFENLRFEHYITDAKKWIHFLNSKFEHVIVLGHSQGALVGSMASQNEKVDKYISLAGMTDNVYNTVKRQLKPQPKFVVDASYPILDSLRLEKKVENVPPFLMSLFDPKTQDYFISFMRYNPREEIKKISIPKLFIIGATDLQIPLDETRIMHEISSNSQLEIIEKMNHVLKKAELETSANMATYSNPEMGLHKDLILRLILFINGN